MLYNCSMSVPDLSLIQQALPGRIVRVMLYGSRARGFDLMMGSGQHLQTIAIDAARTPEGSYFLRSMLEDGLAA